jgi:PIN domain nuclease of toxin-antitoxin system
MERIGGVLIDTHVLAWSLVDPDRIAPVARGHMERSATVFVPPCALQEIALKVRKGAWDAMAPHSDQLDALCAAQGMLPAPFTWRMGMLSGLLDWGHRDPFDRMIAATAVEMALPLISKDTAYDSLPHMEGWMGRIWD